MDISDFTSKASPGNLEFKKDSNSYYSKKVLKKLEDCVLIVKKTVKDNNLTMEIFHKLKIKNANTLLKTERPKMKSIRESIEMPTEDTILQKAINKLEYDKYLNGRTTIKGFVSRAQDSKHLNTYDEYYEALRLDYTLVNGTKNFNKDTDEGLYVIRFCTDALNEIDIPYNTCMKDEINEGDMDYKEPCTGHGFISSLNNEIQPEYFFKNPTKIFNGAEIYYVPKVGEEKLVARYIKSSSTFKVID